MPALAGRRSHRGSDLDIHQAKDQVLAPQSVASEHPLACLVLEVLDPEGCSGRLELLVEWSRSFLLARMVRKFKMSKASVCAYAAVHDDHADKDCQNRPNGEASNQDHAALSKSLSERRTTSINSILPARHYTSRLGFQRLRTDYSQQWFRPCVMIGNIAHYRCSMGVTRLQTA